jgi:phage terminase large subunit-like protein
VGVISLATAIAHVGGLDFVEALTERERLVLACMGDIWLRPDQRIPAGPWVRYGFICGRGFGKTHGIGTEVNRRVECGEARSIGLMAPTLPRVQQVQVKQLISSAPPWFKPVATEAGCRWPNGVEAIGFTPEAPGRCRSENFDLSWATELVDWQASTRVEAFNNFTTATRVKRGGREAQLLWDTTSRGNNDVIQSLLDEHDADPDTYRIQRGSMFDNPVLSAAYLRSEIRKYPPGTRAHGEEVLGLVYGESAGALWHQQWITDHRRFVRPENPEAVLLAIDPGLTGDKTSDVVGMVLGARGRDGHVYWYQDLSKHMSPDMYGDLAIRTCLAEHAAGIVIERNHLGEHAVLALSSAARTHSIQIRLLPRDGSEPFPAYTPGVLYVREVIAASSKASRAGGPANETKAGRVHVVGTMPDLERELTTYEPGASRSPNRFDAAVYLTNELAGLAREETNAAANVSNAAAAHTILKNELARVAARRTI